MEEKKEKVIVNKSGVDLEFATFLRLNILNKYHMLPPVGIEYMNEIAKKNKNAIHFLKLEELASKPITKGWDKMGYPNEEAKNLYREFRKECIMTYADSMTFDSLNLNASETLQPQIIDDQYEELARYLKYEIMYRNGALSFEEILDMEQIACNNDLAFALDDARNKYESGKITRQLYDSVHDNVREQLANHIKEGQKK